MKSEFPVFEYSGLLLAIFALLICVIIVVAVYFKDRKRYKEYHAFIGTPDSAPYRFRFIWGSGPHKRWSGPVDPTASVMLRYSGMRTSGNLTASDHGDHLHNPGEVLTDSFGNIDTYPNGEEITAINAGLYHIVGSDNGSGGDMGAGSVGDGTGDGGGGFSGDGGGRD